MNTPQAIDPAEMLLARAYRAMSRESWQDGETINEVRSAINDFMFNKHQIAKWDELYPRRTSNDGEGSK